MLEDVPLDLRRRTWFQFDGGPPHFPYEVRQFLTNNFQERLIGRGGRISWPPRTPDLKSLHFIFGAAFKRVFDREKFILRKSSN